MPPTSGASGSASETVAADGLDKGSGQTRVGVGDGGVSDGGVSDGGVSNDTTFSPTLQAGMAADIAELRAVVLAAARHLGVDVSRPNTTERPSEVNVDFDSIKPRDEGYDEETTIRRRIELLPTEAMLKDTILWRHCHEGGPPSSLSARLKIQPRNWSNSTEGLQAVLDWSLQGSLSKDVTEFGYTADGYPCTERDRGRDGDYRDHHLFQEHIYISNKSTSPVPSWKGQRFGKEWVFPLHSGSDPCSIPLAVCQLMGGINSFKFQKWVANFVWSFKGSEPWYWLRGSRRFTTTSGVSVPGNIGVSYHMRVLRAGLGSTGQSPSLRREHGWIRTSRIQGWNRLCVDEARISVAVRTTCGLDLPIFTLITLFDISTGTRNWHASIPPSEYLGNLGCIDQWKNRSIRPSTRSTAISAFAYRIHSLCSLWAEEWDFTLNAIESELEVEVADILDRRRRLQLMYDNSELAVSELYFFISQLLRFASVWIRESVDDLRTVVEVLKEKHFSLEEKKNNPQVSFLPDSPEAQRAALEVFRQNWEIVLSHHQKLADGLLGRIAKKQEEVNSLREGLFTATAVSEATKSKQLNHYILVFTVVTIFYLPLSFVAALYALELFSWDDPNQKTSFVITLVVVAGTTYGFAGYLIWFVQAPERRQAAKEKAQRVKSMGNLFK